MEYEDIPASQICPDCIEAEKAWRDAPLKVVGNSIRHMERPGLRRKQLYATGSGEPEKQQAIIDAYFSPVLPPVKIWRMEHGMFYWPDGYIGWPAYLFEQEYEVNDACREDYQEVLKTKQPRLIARHHFIDKDYSRKIQRLYPGVLSPTQRESIRSLGKAVFWTAWIKDTPFTCVETIPE